MDDPVVQDPQNPGLRLASGKSVGTRYSLAAGQQTLEIKCTPFAKFNSPIYSGTATVQYHVIVTPVTMGLVGVTIDSNGKPNILIGQGCTGSLTPISGVTFSNYTWTIGGDTFKSYSPSASQGVVTYLQSADLTAASPHWFWKQQGSATTVSVTATATANGQAIGAVTATRTITIFAPTRTSSTETGHTYLGNPGIIYVPPAIFAGIFDPGFSYGFKYFFSVQTPSTPVNFASQGTGSVETVQLITPGRKRTIADRTVKQSDGFGVKGLDTQYPYYGPKACGTTQWLAVDAPGFTVTNDSTNYTVNEPFEMYFLYKPPGSDSTWVPLYLIGWRWNCNKDRPGTTWPTPSPALQIGNVTIFIDDVQHDHPTWDHLAPNNLP